jgi:hypothetical protein
MTDNDLVFTIRFAYYSKRKACLEQPSSSTASEQGIELRLLRPHPPESNGKVVRFIKRELYI